jgi:hypothetical protein
MGASPAAVASPNFVGAGEAADAGPDVQPLRSPLEPGGGPQSGVLEKPNLCLSLALRIIGSHPQCAIIKCHSQCAISVLHSKWTKIVCHSRSGSDAQV